MILRSALSWIALAAALAGCGGGMTTESGAQHLLYHPLPGQSAASLAMTPKLVVTVRGLANCPTGAICVSPHRPGSMQLTAYCSPSCDTQWTWGATFVKNRTRAPVTTLAAAFSPNPGNPTTNTVTITARTKPGKGYRENYSACTGSGPCTAGAIIVYVRARP
jgi:hypothetical protein